MVLSLISACVGHIRGPELSRGAIFELVFLPTPASFACFADIGFKSLKKNTYAVVDSRRRQES